MSAGLDLPNPVRRGSAVAYHPGMIRLSMVLRVALTVAMCGAAGMAAAQAEPPVPCAFILSTPEVTDVNGTPMVSATASTGGCGAGAGPYLNVACVQPLASDLSNQCTQAHGADAAQVFVPYRPGLTYIATGRGCGAWGGQSPAPLCQVLGPYSATL